MDFPKRGEIWIVSLEPVKGSEIGKTRPALVISNNRNNAFSETITILPITSNTLKVYPFEVFLSNKETKLKNDSKVKCNQIRTIDKKRFLDFLCIVSSEIMEEVRKALLIHLDMN
ncbi:MAG: type II toxin-antitoxin system PemK/MazF family toxin [Atribacterota bacterium]|jgi:mRNA interferase MazF|nr:type II toxin-antitoxin system PemK/MazF family toxin [Atribacterota bacterium]